MANNTRISSIRYSLAPRLSNPTDKNSEKKIYATVQSRETVGLDAIAEHMLEHGSPFTEGCIVGVLKDLKNCMAELLMEGFSVNIPGFERIYLTATCSGADSVEDFTTASIQKLNLRADFDAALEAKINANVEYEYCMTREAEAAAKKAHKEEVQAEQGGTSSNGSGNGGNGDNGEVTE